MRIQNNITAMNTHRQYTINNDNVAKSAEKLSSGYRINRAGDDAAGLAISEKMRSQIRGLNMATKNSQDAISLVQTAEGALQETQNMLQRMNELAVQAATGTNQDIDRGALAKEFEQLKREINDVAEQTTFNNMKILDGSLSYQGYQRSAATAGVTVTRPNIEQVNTGVSTEDLGFASLGLDAGDLGQTIKGGEKATLKFTLGPASTQSGESSANEIVFETRAANPGGEKLGDLLKDPLTPVGDTGKNWTATFADGKIKLTSLNESVAGKSVALAISGKDSSGADISFKGVEATNFVTGSDKVDEPAGDNAYKGTPVSIQVSGLDSEKIGTEKQVATKVTVKGTTLDVLIKINDPDGELGNTALKTAMSTEGITASVVVTGADGWEGTVDTAGTLTLTGPAPKSADDVLAPEDVTVPADGKGTATLVNDGAAAESGGAAATQDLTYGGNAAAIQTLAGTGETEDAKGTPTTITGTLGNDAKVSVANTEKAALEIELLDKDGNAVKGTDGNPLVLKFEQAASGNTTIGELLNQSEVTVDGSKYTLTVDNDGKFTVEGPEGAPNFATATAKLTTDAAGANIANATPTVTVNPGTDAPEEPKTPTAAGPAVGENDVTTVEFDFAKLKDGDEITINLGGTDVTFTKEANATRDDFLKHVDAQLKAADFGTKDSGIVRKGNAIVATGKTVGEPVLTTDATEAAEDEYPTNAIRIQVGALENEQLSVSIDSMNTRGLGLDGFNLDTQDNAGKAITAVRAAINKVSDQRATLGAMQNRLDHKIANLKVSSENLSAAESRIRDVDMASEMTNFTKNNILSQAATAMLAQANSLPQNVLSLLG